MSQKTIKEIEHLLFHSTCADEFVESIRSDKRKGVQRLIQKWEKNLKAKQKLQKQFYDMSQYERKLKKQGYHLIAGIDEVGRGPIAGPVVAAAVILPDDFYMPGINDSKMLSVNRRELFYKQIIEEAVAVGTGIIEANEIDQINIYQAAKKAMRLAVQKLAVVPEALLVDAMDIPINIKQLSLIKGDQKSISIAASSIVAKVTRDRIMVELGEEYPQYGFDSHMGYGTKQHMEAIEKYGIISEHRVTFAPVKERNEKQMSIEEV